MGTTNVQRGRDMGLPAYNQMRQYCGRPKLKSFEEFVAEGVEQWRVDAAKVLYNDTIDVI